MLQDRITAVVKRTWSLLLHVGRLTAPAALPASILKYMHKPTDHHTFIVNSHLFDKLQGS
jgi:hypothetical protein